MNTQRQWTVLLVDDSEDDRYFFTHSFRTAGIAGRIVESEDGDEAIEALQAARDLSSGRVWPDAMFLDLKMPRRDGFEVLGWVRQNVTDRALDIYVLSGSNEPSDIERARELGATDYFTKPITAPKLEELFRAWVGRAPGK